MTALVRILSTSSVDSSPSLLFVAPDGCKTLVNCGEGTQRLFLEYGQRLSSVKTVCLTHLGHESIGGLPGMILTSADSAASAVAAKIVSDAKKNPDSKGNVPLPSEDKIPELEVVGPVGIKNFIHSLRHFMRRDKFKMEILEGHINLLRNHSTQTKKKENSKNVSNNFFSITSIETPSLVAGSKRKHEDTMRKNNSHIRTLSFILKTPPVQGKFLIEKAIELGIPKGSLYSELKSGKSVTFVDANGSEKTVESDEVVTPSMPSQAVLVLYYPTEDIAEELFLDFHRMENLVKGSSLVLVFHLSPRSLFLKYGVNYWNNMNEKTNAEHVFLTTVPCGVMEAQNDTPFQSAALGARTRSYLCSKIYASPKTQFTIPLTQTYREGEFGKLGERMLEYTLIPVSKRGFQQSMEMESLEGSDLKRTVVDSGAFAAAQEILVEYDLSDSSDSEAELFFTGTGSAIPCKYRNVSGIMFKQSDGRSMLLDVGEGTVGQLLRSNGNGTDSDLVRNIKAVWISHPHADHHLGLLRLLHERKGSDPVIVIAPTPIFRFLDEYYAIDPSIKSTYEAIDSKMVINYNPNLQRMFQSKIGIENIRAVPVQHCPHSFACIVYGTSFGTLVYSGDCRPSNQLVREAQNADLLIHEATFEDGMESDAALKMHSTIGEALDVAHRMNAKCTILTHFSQRYPQIPPIRQDISDTNPVIFAFDFMKLTPTTLHLASKLTSALRMLYPVVEESSSGPETDAKLAMSIPGAFAHTSWH